MSDDYTRNTLSKAILEAAAEGWDAAVKSLRHEDGSPVELLENVNPYRVMIAEEFEGDA
jgi:hypothetical protein